MENNGDYNGVLTSAAYSGAVTIRIEKDRLDFQTNNETISLDFALIQRISAANFHLLIAIADGDFELSQLGYNFEGFCQELESAFSARGQEALFVSGTPLIEANGEYFYEDPGGSAQGSAVIRLFQDCVCILPNDDGARRIPLCFVADCVRENYTLQLTLDTAEHYELIRLGRKTDAFFELLRDYREKARTVFAANLRRLEKEERSYPEEIQQRLRTFRVVCSEKQVIKGCFAPSEAEMKVDETGLLPFWFVGLGRDRAAVELFTGEKTAAYLYRFDEDPAVFLARLRHAMEAVKDHREVIYLEKITPQTVPLYAMAVRRSVHLCFLRNAMTGRLIHDSGWEEKLSAFFKS